MRAAACLIALILPLGVAEAADRALLIGIDKHADARLDARTGTPAADDLAGIRLLLSTKLGFTDPNIRTLTNGEATADGIKSAMKEWLVDGTAAGERVYLYFAGNGYFAPDESGDDKDGLDEGLVASDAKLSVEGGTLAIDGLITDDLVSEFLSALKDRKVTLVVDAGFSGRVSRGDAENEGELLRAPPLAEATRAIVVEAKGGEQVGEQKAEGGWLDPFEGADLVAWTAVSASQTAMIDASDPKRIGGLFTRLYLEGLGEGKADKNGNGNVSNAELLNFITEGSQAYCTSHKAQCEMGLTPRLEPEAAHAESTLPDTKVAAKAKAKLEADAVTDLLAKGNPLGISVKMTPDGPITVGMRDMRFHVTSPHDGFLILLNLTDQGDLIQLFPNQFSRKQDREGRIRAGAPLMVPDSYYGVSFDATTPSSGQIIAVVAKRKVDWDKAVGTRAIEVIPREEAVKSFLPQIAAALGQPAATSSPEDNTEAMEWSVASLRYEIGPKQ